MFRVSKVVPPKHQNIKDISLSFFPGAKIGLLGLNDSGKSTVLLLNTMIFLAVFLSGALLNYTEAGIGSFVAPVIVFIMMLVLWIAAWSFGGRLFAGKTNFIPHANIGLMGITLFLASDMLITNIRNENDLERQSYRSTIGPLFLLFAEGMSPEAFIASMATLKSRVQE